MKTAFCRVKRGKEIPGRDIPRGRAQPGVAAAVRVAWFVTVHHFVGFSRSRPVYRRDGEVTDKVTDKVMTP
jgi:hypothetical protein